FAATHRPIYTSPEDSTSAVDSTPSEMVATECAASPTLILTAASTALATIPSRATRAAVRSGEAMLRDYLQLRQMREPLTAVPSELESIPDRPAVFLLWAGEGAPYLARTTKLRRRLKRLLSDRESVSRVLNLRGVVERIEYWLTGSQLESALIHLNLAKQYFPEDVARITRLKPPVFLRLTLDNPFPRTMLTTRLGRGLFYGPFANRVAAERYQNEMLDLFQLRRCEDNLAPSPEHPGCIYGEMNKCLRPCQQVVSVEEYRGEAQRVEEFIRTDGASLRESAEAARDRASAAMRFEEAEQLHQRLDKI